MTEAAIYKWAAGFLGAALLGLIGFLGGQVSLTGELTKINEQLANIRAEVLVLDAKLDALTTRFEDAR